MVNRTLWTLDTGFIRRRGWNAWVLGQQQHYKVMWGRALGWERPSSLCPSLIKKGNCRSLSFIVLRWKDTEVDLPLESKGKNLLVTCRTGVQKLRVRASASSSHSGPIGLSLRLGLWIFGRWARGSQRFEAEVAILGLTKLLKAENWREKWSKLAEVMGDLIPRGRNGKKTGRESSSLGSRRPKWVLGSMRYPWC